MNILYICPFCTIFVTHQYYYYIDHIELIHPNESIPCYICSNKLKSKITLRNHIKRLLHIVFYNDNYSNKNTTDHVDSLNNDNVNESYENLDENVIEYV